jgi:mannose-1-phosphate guanylyltransferase/mannose-1-phosphate guanylyltransferase/mannose-6-phosphate isomerase
MTYSIFPVILSGGTGSRLWPLSREAYPKQLLALDGDKTLIQQAALRMLECPECEPPIIIANSDHRFIIAEQLHALDITPYAQILEPCGRNTAPAIIAAALHVQKQNPKALLLVMPADHSIGDSESFTKTALEGAKEATNGNFVLFGIRPITPHTGYGYIEAGNPISENSAIRHVISFQEKPNELTAESYLNKGNYFWNSGIFLLPVDAFLQEAQKLCPEIIDHVQNSLSNAVEDLDFIRLEEEAFKKSSSISIDYAIMEKTNRAVVVEAHFPWTDLGNWSALADMATKDSNGNTSIGSTYLHETKNSYIRSDGPLIATIGLENVIIVATPDAVLITPKSRDQEVKEVLSALKASGAPAATELPLAHRPWGTYRVIDEGDRFQVKEIMVKPGGRLSLQKHFHRAEHWVVVNGTALVTIDDQKKILAENESVYIPLGAVHRLENPGKIPLNLIEVQSGAYLNEDDIVRLEDVYARQ